MVHFTCPHCGKRTSRPDLSDADVEYVDLGNGLPDAVFPALAAGDERHIDTRLCCTECFERADDRPRDERGQRVGPHRYTQDFHRARLARPDKRKE